MEQPASGGIGKWLRERCEREKLSLRQAAARTGLSHTTISEVMDSGNASPDTIRKLAQAFGDGQSRLAIEDELLVLAGHRTSRPDGEELTEPMARLLDKLHKLSGSQLKLVGHFADFISEIKEK